MGLGSRVWGSGFGGLGFMGLGVRVESTRKSTKTM